MRYLVIEYDKFMDFADETKHCTAESNDQESTSAAVKSLNKKHCKFV